MKEDFLTPPSLETLASQRLGPEAFQSRGTKSLAKNLLGNILWTVRRGVLTAGRIVETEAYLSTNDPACHASRGRTERNAPMFQSAGFSYVYLIYGMYYCFNVVSGKKDCGEAVLIRALEPLSGLKVMEKRRNSDKLSALASGPGKLCQALAINQSFNKVMLYQSSKIGISADCYSLVGEKDISSGPRIGISNGKSLALRFTLKDSPFLSK